MSLVSCGQICNSACTAMYNIRLRQFGGCQSLPRPPTLPSPIIVNAMLRNVAYFSHTVKLHHITFHTFQSTPIRNPVTTFTPSPWVTITKLSTSIPRSYPPVAYKTEITRRFTHSEGLLSDRTWAAIWSDRAAHHAPLTGSGGLMGTWSRARPRGPGL